MISLKTKIKRIINMFGYIISVIIGMMFGIFGCSLLIKLAPKKWFEDILDEDE